MLNALKKALGFLPTRRSNKPVEAQLFSGSAYFSNSVPTTFLETWVAHGGEISSGTTWDKRARYFFAIDPEEPWVTKLFAKSVLVFHAEWIAHCVDKGFQVPIGKYVLDDRFVPEPPIYVPLSEPAGYTVMEPGETESTSVQTSDTPSTPTSMPRKRKLEQAYFDSPSGSLVFSGFNKDGMPRRPKKQRKIRFDLSFSPDGGMSGVQALLGLDLLQDHRDLSRDDDEFGKEHVQDGISDTFCGYVTAAQLPDTPDKPLGNGGLITTRRLLSMDEHLPSTYAFPPARSTDQQEKMPPVRTIDFTNLPPRTRRWRFPEADDTKPKDTDMALSIVKTDDHKVKTPKKISFANHARVRVFSVSPRRYSKDDTGPVTTPSLNQGFEGGLVVDRKTWVSSNDAKGCGDSTAEAIKHLALRPDLPKIGDDSSTGPLDGEDQSEDDTLTLTMEQVQEMRQCLTELAETNGVESGQLATLFEVGKTFRGMTFHHVW